MIDDDAAAAIEYDGELRAPFPYFGGKATIAAKVWARFGDVDNYVEPFCGSCAMLLSRPEDHRGTVETVSDANHFIANFWRAVQRDPQAVASYADWPVNEVDCHARHAWLMRSEQSAEIRHRVESDPDYFDARTAGWWCWGQSLWIGSGWCLGNQAKQRPQIGNATGRGVHRKRPHIGNATGSGVHRKLPQISNATGGGECELRREWLVSWMVALSDRLRNVRVCCGDWSRVCSSPSTVERLGSAGIFLDPPYMVVRDSGESSRCAGLYQGDDAESTVQLRDEVLAWCRKWGQSPTVLVCLAEYEGHGYEVLENEGWSVELWESCGGYANHSGQKNDNALRERLWFSPACKQIVAERMLF